MQRGTARAAGGTINRLKPGPATVFSRSKNDDISGPILLYALLRGEIYVLRDTQYAPFPTILSPFAFAERRPRMRLGSHSADSRGASRASRAQKLKTVTLGNEPVGGNP